MDEPLAAAGAVVARFDFPAADRGQIDLRFEYGADLLTGRGGLVRDRAGKILAAFDGNWEWNPARSALLSKQEHAAAGVRHNLHPNRSTPPPAAGAEFYRRQRSLCERRWRNLRGRRHERRSA